MWKLFLQNDIDGAHCHPLRYKLTSTRYTLNYIMADKFIEEVDSAVDFRLPSLA